MTLPSKFNSYSLNAHPCLNLELKKNADEVVSGLPLEEVSPLWTPVGFSCLGEKPHILEHPNLPGFILKRDCKTGTISHYAKNTVIYRLRKAEKIRRVLKENFENHLISVPNKYLYTTRSGEHVVLSEKLTIYPLRKDEFINKRQAKALVRLILEAGFTDCHIGNIYKNSVGKLVIIDTEPPFRGAKLKHRTWTRRWLRDKSFSLAEKTSAMEKLRIICTTEASSYITKASTRFKNSIQQRTFKEIVLLIAGMVTCFLVFLLGNRSKTLQLTVLLSGMVLGWALTKKHAEYLDQNRVHHAAMYSAIKAAMESQKKIGREIPEIYRFY